MRNLLLILGLIAVTLFGVFVLLPIIGVVLVVVVGVLVLAPLLIRLPWFRNRIIIRRFDFTPPHQPPQPPGHRPPDDDVIEIEGRELPPDDEKRD